MNENNKNATLPGFEVDDQDCCGFSDASRVAGMQRLHNFAPRAAKSYASGRNFDFGAGMHRRVSTLSPWIRHRLITEEEVLTATLDHHSLSGAEKFMQEVFWRSYFKGWLEQRPGVWTAYRRGVANGLGHLDRNPTLRADYDAATGANTGIACFDHWGRELIETGYLHNHARMWFASIWIFTLNLPWELGADFFLRHLIDGDPASNTLSWRWVGGLHTKGKTYLARASNIAKYTDGRWSPTGQLATEAPPLSEDIEAPSVPIPAADEMPTGDYTLLTTEEDLTPESLTLPGRPGAVLGLLATQNRSPLPTGEQATRFARDAMADALDRATAHFATPAHAENTDWTSALTKLAHKTGHRTIVTAYAPTGPVAEELAAAKPQLQQSGITLLQIRRPYDDAVWPHATKGFFAVRKKIPDILRTLNLTG